MSKPDVFITERTFPLNDMDHMVVCVEFQEPVHILGEVHHVYDELPHAKKTVNLYKTDKVHQTHSTERSCKVWIRLVMLSTLIDLQHRDRHRTDREASGLVWRLPRIYFCLLSSDLYLQGGKI